MAKRTRWWAIWSAEYPDEGSIHYLARTRAEALGKARRSAWFKAESMDEPLELVAAPVTPTQHRQWLRSKD